ncbi:aminotransferase class V-fold PLP-dependent enzyme [Deinococcus yavapaiensis]|uniref:Alanine-glyoxylate transaminase/serine-glyoxylate transaminase/serine-pyruvate transaminase n=1 Tax=Deinococcus yavapaiensis KR-236 TaxID=694435 RepID=A0A318SG51_9DEIO|nr:aminotransferase class V-fold PLP-dependent enzyme [Deinococcus yavapaiensis]PYE53031.1 alanine-glyoxylate transaminase/serine-glyoxylate transaminase/serine-pyruvate transaminase [Deinococcus yavapaiensis KR-236]
MLRSHSKLVLLTPGPTPLHDEAVSALALPMLGHMDAEVLNLNAEIQADLRVMYGAPNAFTALLSGTGSLGMEAGFANLVEAGDDVLVLVNGTFGARMAEMAARYGANVRVVTAPSGEAIDPDDVARHLGRARMVALVHGETSTGVLNPLPDIARIVREKSDALLCVDAVTTVGMGPFDMEGLGIDYAYTGSQKCLSAPPGVAPVAISPRALARFDARRTPTPLWYCDFGGLRDYWEKRSYHHTVPVNLHFALHAALRAALREGLYARAARARDVGFAVLSALQPAGFTPFVPTEAARLPTVLALRLPPGLDDAAVRAELRRRGMSVTGGLGDTAGLIWRLGLMGESARPHLYRPFLATLEDLLGERDLVRRFDAALSLQVAAD